MLPRAPEPLLPRRGPFVWPTRPTADLLSARRCKGGTTGRSGGDGEQAGTERPGCRGKQAGRNQMGHSDPAISDLGVTTIPHAALLGGRAPEGLASPTRDTRREESRRGVEKAACINCMHVHWLAVVVVRLRATALQRAREGATLYPRSISSSCRERVAFGWHAMGIRVSVNCGTYCWPI